jgi:NTP pyrophosphatase (non-canonical NTP hydrolase)
MITDLTELAKDIHSNARAHGFHPTDQPIEVFLANQCNNIHSEVSELWDAFRAGWLNCKCDKDVQLSYLEEELSDIIIRALDVSQRFNVDITTAINRKHEYNKTRPFRHGKLN